MSLLIGMGLGGAGLAAMCAGMKTRHTVDKLGYRAEAHEDHLNTCRVLYDTKLNGEQTEFTISKTDVPNVHYMQLEFRNAIGTHHYTMLAVSNKWVIRNFKGFWDDTLRLLTIDLPAEGLHYLIATSYLADLAEGGRGVSTQHPEAIPGSVVTPRFKVGIDPKFIDGLNLMFDNYPTSKVITGKRRIASRCDRTGYFLLGAAVASLFPHLL